MPRTPDPGALQYDLRADHVTRRRQPASRAFMPTLRKRLGHGRSAYAHLAGSTRIHLHQLSPGARSLVPEFGKERVPSGVVDRAGQYSARKSFDVQVFHRDQPVAFHQPTAEIMMKGGTLVSDFTVRLGHECGGLAAAVAAALATGSRRWARRRCANPRLRCRGLSISMPFERATKLSSPTSMPISSDDSGNATLSRSTEKHTYQWFTSRLIVTVLISPSTGRCSLTLTRPVPWIRNFPSSSNRQPSP